MTQHSARKKTKSTVTSNFQPLPQTIKQSSNIEHMKLFTFSLHPLPYKTKTNVQPKQRKMSR